MRAATSTRQRSPRKPARAHKRDVPGSVESTRLWLFDFDNTIARLEPVVNWPAVRTEVRAILERAQAPREITEQVPPRSLGMYDSYRAHLESSEGAARAGSAAMLTRISRLIEKYELADVDRAEPLEGARELLRALATLGMRVAIVTSNSSAAVRRWLRRNRVHGAIESIVGRDSGLALKPSPAMVSRALEIAGVAPRSAAFVGDSPADLEAARAARVAFYGIAPSPEARDRLLLGGATRIFASPAALAIELNLAASPPVRGRSRKPRDGRRN
jgi:HAD superfamily hydrolase (TIGR01549 family)